MRKNIVLWFYVLDSDPSQIFSLFWYLHRFVIYSVISDADNRS